MAPACPSSWIRCKSITLSAKKSLKSTKVPLRTFSTTLAGMGGKAGDKTSGDAFAAAGNTGPVMAGSGDDSSDASEGIADEVMVAAAPGTVEGVSTGSDGDVEDVMDVVNNGTEAIDAAGGIVTGTEEALLPTGINTNNDAGPNYGHTATHYCDLP